MQRRSPLWMVGDPPPRLLPCGPRLRRARRPMPRPCRVLGRAPSGGRPCGGQLRARDPSGCRGRGLTPATPAGASARATGVGAHGVALGATLSRTQLQRAST